MKSNEKIKRVAKEFLSVFDAKELTGRKKNLIRAGDAFCFVVKEVMYPAATLEEIANLFNAEFKKNKKNYLHSDVIMAIRRHHDRFSSSFCKDDYYIECVDGILVKLGKQHYFDKNYEKEFQEQ
jgi:hypothetical protein